MTRKDVIKFRRGTAAEWANSEPQPGGEVLRLGEPGYEKDTGKLKIGDGVTAWNSLPYLQSENNQDVILQPEDVQDVVGASGFLIPGSGINIVYDDDNDNLTISTSGNAEFDKISFNITADPTIETAEIGWDEAQGTLDLGLEGGTKIHVGEHNYFRIRNNTGSILRAGQAVYVSDVHNNSLIEASLYTADGTIREIRFMGLVLTDIDINQKGYAINFGHVENLDTRGNGAVNGDQNLYAADEPAWVEGDILYVHPTVPGKLTKVEPKHSISAAIVLYVSQNTGRIFVRPTSYGHLDDNHDVDLAGLQNDHLLVYNSNTNNWEPSSYLTYSTDNNTLRLIADETIGNFRINQFYNADIEPSRLIFRRARGTQVLPEIANSGDGIFAVRGESLDYNKNVTILGGLRMEIVDEASSTSLNPSARIYLRTSSGGDNLLDKTVYLNPDGTLLNTGTIQGRNFYQQTSEDNTLNGSLTVNNGLSAPTLIYAPSIGTIPGPSVNFGISYAIDRQIQVFANWQNTVTNINFIEGSNWPSAKSVDVLLELTFTNPINVIWSIVDDWYNPPPNFVAGKYLVLLRSINGTIQGHYIGEKTN
jgi:hypothetical protein